MGYGVDLGSSGIKVVSVKRTLGGYKVIGAARKRLAKGSDKLAQLKALAETLGPRNGQRAGVVGLSGRDINLQVVQQPAMKPLNYRVMMGYEMDQRKGEATDLYLDFCTLREPDAFFPQYLALIGIGKSAYVDERIDLLAKSNLDVRDAVPNSFALFAAYHHAYGTEPGTVMLLDIGADNMDFAFVRGGRLIFARNVSSGARVFDQQIAGATGCSPEEAEAMKVATANLGPSEAGEDEEAEGSIRGPVRSAAGQLSGFITSSINHAKGQLNDRELAIDKIYLSGGGARVKGLPEYLSAALKIPVEILDPFQKVDTSAVEKLGASQIRELPTDLAVAVGLAQLVSPPASATTLSILPDALKKRRAFFRTNLWLALAGSVLLATLLVLTVLSTLQMRTKKERLEEFLAQTADITRRMDEMEVLEREQREMLSKSDYLLSHLSGGRVLLDSISRLSKSLPAEIRLRDVRITDPGSTAKAGSRGRDNTDRMRAAFTVRRRGLVMGEVESDTDQEIRIVGQGDPFRDEDIVDGIKQGVIRWPSYGRAIFLTGEIDENIRGGARDALNAMRDQLSDASRGVRATIQNQKASDKPGWRQFEIVIAFD
ncbi:MAG: pilus assembly protein PilM [Planctomycetaceae bacterium]|nr:pilus assembly protein PilM [Planctomycetaceae bacterium]